MLARARLREMDWVLLAIVVLISLIGISEVISTTQSSAQFGKLYHRHLAWLAAGFLIMLMLARADYHFLMDQAGWIYAATLAALVAVLLFGTVIFGARRWLSFGGMTFQVSEVAKWAIIIVLAKYLSEVRGRYLTVWDLVKVAVLMGIPLVLIAAEPDLGTALTLIPITVVIVWMAGIRWKHLIIIAVGAALMAPVAWYALKPYQRERVVAFMNPSQSIQGQGYQTFQSQIAIGSGGIRGNKEPGKRSQSELGYIPVQHAEFIMAAYAEERGFAGVLIILGLYLALLLRLLHIAELSPDRSGAFLVTGVFGLLAFHLAVNVGMVLGFLPVTGIPLQLMSYGGSSTIATFMMLGLVQSVRMRRYVNR